MSPSEAARIALKLFEEVQVGRHVEGVLVEAIEVPKPRRKEWQVTIGYSPFRELLGVPVAGPRLRSVIRLAEDGTFIGMHAHERDDS